MAKVRLSIRPDEETEVPDDEVAVLRGQGLLVEDAKPAVPTQQEKAIAAAMADREKPAGKPQAKGGE